MRIFDENGKEIFEHPLLDLMDEYNNQLTRMSEEERLKVFQNLMYLEPLKYTQDIGDTTYVIRTCFNENGSSKVIETVSRLMEKKEL